MKRVSFGLVALGLAALFPVMSGSLHAENVALAASGASDAAASSTGFNDDGIANAATASHLIDGMKSGANSYWTDETVDEFPDVAQVNFFGRKTLDRVVVYSVQDNVFDGVDPTDDEPCYVYGLVDFTVEGWNGRDWVTLGNVTDNLLCKRTVTFPPFTTDAIRINVAATGGWSLTRIAEVEAFVVQ